MAAQDHLNEELFHGTSRRFKKGELILPASKTGVRPNWGVKSKNNPNLAHATNSLDSAQYYARVSALVNRTGRARVYQVAPVDPQSASWTEKKFAGGAGGSSTLREHTSSEGYRVLKRVWIGKQH